ncbi:hypothetical protein AAVH_16459 [Aphelenchoides avenae]|nr:hypothetical protein AAVH_16459 [Aphelenchus avenae]
MNRFNITSIDVAKLLRKVAEEPDMAKQVLSILAATQPEENRTALSWDYDDLFLWASFEGVELNIT